MRQPFLTLKHVHIREDVKISTYKPHTNHKRSSVRSHTLAPTTICDLSHSVCWSPLTDLGHINSVTYVCHPLWFVCGHRKGILTSPLIVVAVSARRQLDSNYAWMCVSKSEGSFYSFEGVKGVKIFRSKWVYNLLHH